MGLLYYAPETTRAEGMRHEEGHTLYSGSKIWGDILVVFLKIIDARRGGPATALGTGKLEELGVLSK